MAENRDESCESRIQAHMGSRETQFARYFDLDNMEPADLLSAYTDRYKLEDLLDEDALAAIAAGEDHPGYDDAIEEVRADMEREGTDHLDEDLLAISTKVVMRIELSTGGPGDWIEAELDEDRDVQAVSYHFNDWFDHAERRVDGDSPLWALAAYYAEVVSLPGDNRDSRPGY